jgi:hypothetical protein
VIRLKCCLLAAECASFLTHLGEPREMAQKTRELSKLP